MKRSYLYFLTILFSCLLVLFSCRKDIEFILDGKESPSASVLENAKIYYMQNINSASVNRLDAKWKDSWLIKQNGKEILLTPTPERKLFSKDFDVRRYFAFEIKNEQVVLSNIVEIIGKGDDVSKHTNALISKSKDTSYDFDGSIIYYDINYKYSHSYVYAEGKIKENLNSSILTAAYSDFKEKQSTYLKSNTKKTASATTCPGVLPFWTNIIPAAAFGEGCTVTIYTETTRDQNGCVTKITHSYTGHSCPSVCTTCGSGSGSGSGSDGSGSGIGSSTTTGNPPYGGGGGAIIVNNVKDPCVKKMVDSIISKDIEFKTRQSLYIIFGQTNDFNLYFYDNDPTLSYNTLGTCLASNLRYSQGQLSGMDATIQLNSPRLSTMSQEIIAVTTVHEGIHAYLSYKGFISQNNQAQHVEMLKSQVSLMANYLITKFNTPAKEAYALAFNGLDVAFNELTSATKNQIITELSTSLGTTFPTLSERAIIMADYEMGYKGKKCTPPVQP
ncbi:hypothetical protein [Sphingobacterium sp.]|uniref:hypothetical protein n=1 Tax=Sphingobacterium sp. TaxID=341027 RepID=UPI0031D96E37